MFLIKPDRVILLVRLFGSLAVVLLAFDVWLVAVAFAASTIVPSSRITQAFDVIRVLGVVD